MKNRIFLPSSESLEDAFQFIHPSFKPLAYLLPQDLTLEPHLIAFINETFVMEDPDPPIPSHACEDAHKFQDVVNQNIRQLLAISKTNYIQCLGHQFRDYSLCMKSLNFGKTILQSSHLAELTKILGLKFAKQLIYNFTIVMKYQNDYFQVTGIALPQKLNFKNFADKKKKNIHKGPNHYGGEIINRFQMLYCSHTNRNSGLLRKNVFFDQGVRKSSYFQQVKLLAEKQVNSMFTKKFLKPEQFAALEQHIYNYINKVRDIFELKRRDGRNFCQFDSMLARYCPLPQDYKDIRDSVYAYLKDQIGSSQDLFERMYINATPYNNLYQLLSSLIKKILPQQLLGHKNTIVFISLLKDFISMKRYENHKIEEIINKMNVFEIPWMKLNYNKKFKKRIISKWRKVLSLLVCMIYNKLLIPLIKHNFYVTEKHKQANKLFYYRKPIWVLVSKLALKKFSQTNLQPITQNQYFQIKKAGTDYPQGKLRLMPKKGTFRPIITFNRKRKVEGDFYKATLNQILSDTQLVLRNLKNILGTQVGFCIFDNKQISKKYDEFVQRWREKGSPKLVYFTLDIKKCYDSIDTNMLVRIIEETPLIENTYMLIRYLRVYRNKKPLNEIKPLSYYFNMKQRVHATSLTNDPMKVSEDRNVAAFNIYMARQKLITRAQIIKKLKQLCDGSIIRYKKNAWLQKLGIPQGLNVSGVLCSLYFAQLQKQFVRVEQGLLMRLTDDYIYIGPEGQAIQVLSSLLKCAQNNKFVFNSQKINKNFKHPQIDKITDDEYIHWIGKKINIDTLEIFPAFDQSSDKLAYAMNVNINRKHIKSFLKNKLKSLLTNHFAAYFKPSLFELKNLIQNVRLYCRISMAKFFPFLVQLNKLKVQNEPTLIIKILQVTIHEYLIYICSFLETKNRHYLYHKFLQVVLDEFSTFMRSKRSYQFLRPVERVFRNRCLRMTKELTEYEKSHSVMQE